MIAAVSFDADGTLWDFQRAMRRSLAHTLAELQRLLPDTQSLSLTVDQLVAVRNEVAEELSDRSMEHIRFAAFTRTLERIGYPDVQLAHHLTSIYLARRFADIELYSDVLPALDELQSTYRLGLLSNGNTYPDRCSLPGRFDFVVFAQDYGVRKPDPRFYQIAIAQAGVEPNQLLHVGDSLVNDVAPAQTLGIRTVWLNRSGLRHDGPPRPDAEIRSLAQLARVLTDLVGRAHGKHSCEAD